MVLSLSWPNSSQDAGDSPHVLYRPVLMQVSSCDEHVWEALVWKRARRAVMARRWVEEKAIIACVSSGVLRLAK